jgi:hypothetical protein
MIEVVQTRDTFDRAIAEDHEAARLGQQLAALRQESGAAREGLRRLQARHRVELEDVERLEGIGLTAVLAAVRGTRTGSLDRERAEEVAARFAMQTALADLNALESRRESVEQRLATLGDTRARREAAAEAHAVALRASGAAVPGLEAALDELATVRAQAAEVTEAQEAGIRAASALEAARRELGSADSWSAYDTWFGGGLISSSIKHHRIDAAGSRIAAAQDALVDLARELSDVDGLTGLRADLGISPTTRTFDVWFDNIFSDLSVRSSIKDSTARVDASLASVREAMRTITVRAATLEQQAADLLRRRDALLGE